MQDLIGQNYGQLRVVAFEGHRKRGDGRKGASLWRCLCACGQETVVGRTNLVSGNTQSCGCLRLRRDKDNPRWRATDGISNTLWGHILRSADCRGLEVTVDREYLSSLFHEQQGKCALSGLPIDLMMTVNNRGTASLDRIDSSLGYVRGNVQWVHKTVNAMKNSLSDFEFMSLCHTVAVYNKGKSLEVLEEAPSAYKRRA